MKKRFFAFALIICLCVAILGGCADTSYAAKSGDKKFPVSVYAYYAYQIRDYYQSMLENYGVEAKDFNDMLTTEISSGLPFYSMIIDYAKSSYTSYVIISEKFDELGLTLSEDVQKEIDEYTTENFVKVYGEDGLADICRTLDMSGSEFRDVVSVSYKSDMLMEYFFGRGGEYEVTEEEQEEIFDKDYERFKYIVIGKLDAEGKSLSTEELVKKMNLANEAYDKAKNGTNFESLIPQYSEDYYTITDDLTAEEKKNKTEANSVMINDGLVVDRDGAIDYTSYSNGYKLDSNIVDKLFTAKEGDIEKIELSNAFWIIKKYDKYEDEKYYNSKKTLIYNSIVEPISNELVEKWTKDMNIEFNTQVVNMYDPRKISSLFITESSK